jgi:hypothetical protein
LTGRVVAVLLLLAASCGDRELTLEIHTPRDCCRPINPDAGCVEDPCPLRMVRSIETVLERADGTVAYRRCGAPPDGLCAYEDLRGYRFIGSVEPSDGIEVRVEGFAAEGCPRPDPGQPTTDPVFFRCDSFGDNVVDLRRGGEIPMWCECAPLTR